MSPHGRGAAAGSRDRSWRSARDRLIITAMKTLKARVRNGHLILDEPSDFPEGTEIELALVDAGDELDPEESAALQELLSASWTEALRGDKHPADELVARLRRLDG